MDSRSPSPPGKRIKLEQEQEDVEIVQVELEEEEEEEDQCIICLNSIADRTLIPPCSHDAFCFECIVIWSEQSRKCPLCTQSLGDHLIHNIHSKYNFQKFFLPPLPSVPPGSVQPALRVQSIVNRRARPIRERRWGRRQADDRVDEFERALEKRRKIYQYRLYAKHTASNPHTKYKPYPTPTQFAANQELVARATAFLRRELRVWVNLDVEFLTSFTISIMKSIDIRTEAAVRLIGEFLDMDEHGNVDPNRTIAEHFAHEVYSFMRSPYKDLFVYDTVVQYDPFPESNQQHNSRSRFYPKPSYEGRRGRSLSRSRSRSRSISYSPSGRYYPSERRRRQEHDREQRSRSPTRSRSPQRRRTGSPGISQSHAPTRTNVKRKGKEREVARRSPSENRLSRSPSPQVSRSKGKGKEREEPPPSRSRTRSTGPSQEAEECVSRSGPSVTGVRQTSLEADEKPAHKPLRQPKRRTLLESVQDHLGSSTAQSSKAPSTSAHKLSLLDRLSRPGNTPLVSEEGKGMVAEAMNTVISTPDASNTPTPSSVTVASSPAHRDEDMKDVIGSSHMTPVDSPRPTAVPKTDARSLLLRRLIEEKKKTSKAPANDKTVVDLDAVENELRQRAHRR